MPGSVRLEAFARGDVERIEHWFDDGDTQRFLGGRDWIRRAPSLPGLTVGTSYRGQRVTGRSMWLAVDAAAAPVAFVDAETYDRYAAWDGSDPDAPVLTDVVRAPAMGFAIVVDPSRRRSGFGAATVAAVVELARREGIGIVVGGVEADNAASRALMRRAGFAPRSSEPDSEGMLTFALDLREPARR